MLWGLLVFLTLGLALPWREASLERYKMRHTHYGDLQGDFEGDGWEFFKRGWWLWLAHSDRGHHLSARAVPLCRVQGASNGAGGSTASRSAASACPRTLPHDAFIGLYWKMVGW